VSFLFTLGAILRDAGLSGVVECLTAIFKVVSWRKSMVITQNPSVLRGKPAITQDLDFAEIFFFRSGYSVRTIVLTLRVQTVERVNDRLLNFLGVFKMS
jgi:hypothetical protein